MHTVKMEVLVWHIIYAVLGTVYNTSFCHFFYLPDARST